MKFIFEIEKRITKPNSFTSNSSLKQKQVTLPHNMNTENKLPSSKNATHLFDMRHRHTPAFIRSW